MATTTTDRDRMQADLDRIDERRDIEARRTYLAQPSQAEYRDARVAIDVYFTGKHASACFILPGHEGVVQCPRDKDGKWDLAKPARVYATRAVLPALDSLVETEVAAIAHAETVLLRKARRMCQEELSVSKLEDIPATWDELLKDERTKKLMERWNGSVQAEFHDDQGRCPNPVLRYEIVAEDLPPVPERHSEALRRTVETVAEVMAPSVSPGEIATAMVEALIAAGVITPKKGKGE